MALQLKMQQRLGLTEDELREFWHCAQNYPFASKAWDFILEAVN